MAKTAKTNAMRILDKEGLAYTSYTYGGDEFLDGITVAGMIGKPMEQVFKTLVTRGTHGEIFVFVIPVAQELALKEAAKAVGEKAVDMLPAKEITAITGYLKGGCSPIGMKKLYRTVIDASAQNLTTMIFSAGKRGMQLEMAPQDLAKVCHADFAQVAAV